MKKTKKIIYIYICLIISATGCNDDFLDRAPLDAVSPNTFFKSPNDLKLFTNNLYTSFPVHTGFGLGNFGADGNSDNMLPELVNGRLDGTGTVPATGGGWSWGNIRHTNYGIENSVTVPESDEKNVFLGELRFFRAWYYFQLVKNFGDVPLVLRATNIDSEELFAARTPRNQVVDAIVEDLDFAIDNLNWKSSSESNRLSKEAAYAFKSRVCLFEGTWEKYHAGTRFGVSGQDGTEFLNLAVEASEALINSGMVELYNTGNPGTDYHNVFNQVSLSSVSEAILWRAYDADQGTGHNLSNRIPTLASGLGLTESLVDSYLDTDGVDVDHSVLYAGDGNYADFAKDRDPRLAQTVLNIGDVMAVSQAGEQTLHEFPTLHRAADQYNPSGYMLYKGTNLDPNQIGTNVGTVAAIIFRYAEVLLNFAEAKAELGTITTADLDKSINLLRARAGMPDMDFAVEASNTKAFPSLSTEINSVRRERRVELACEGRRRDDLLRWAAMDELIVGKRLTLLCQITHTLYYLV